MSFYICFEFYFAKKKNEKKKNIIVFHHSKMLELEKNFYLSLNLFRDFDVVVAYAFFVS